MKKILQQPSASIERLLQHGRYLEYLSKRLLTYLPDEFAGKISVLAISSKGNKFSKDKKPATGGKQTLIVAVCSPAWASKLRFYTPTLKRSLTAEAQFSQLQSIKVKVAFANINTKIKKKNPVYSQNSAKIIENNAQHISDKELKEALMRLSRHIAEKC
ncbi:MAG: DciA family protein [Gammaproteobacteria bacterium]|nr:DciA family protein [Gammaproteobacteria bacterium]